MPSPQPMSRMRSPGCGASRSRTAAPSLGTYGACSRYPSLLQVLFIEQASVSSRGHRQQRERIDARAAEAHGPVQMRTGDPAGGADEADDLRLVNTVTGLDVQPREVREQRVKTEAVIDHDRVAREEQLFGEHDRAGGGCGNRRSRRTRKISAAMRTPRLTVENAAQSETAGRRRGDR